jgi:hypothetical protein
VKPPLNSRSSITKRTGCSRTNIEGHQQVARLLGDPGAGRVRRAGDELDSTALKRDEEKHVDPLQPGSFDGEEITGERRRRVLAQKVSPSELVSPRRGRQTMTGEDRPRRSRRNGDAKAPQLADDPPITPTPLTLSGSSPEGHSPGRYLRTGRGRDDDRGPRPAPTLGRPAQETRKRPCMIPECGSDEAVASLLQPQHEALRPGVFHAGEDPIEAAPAQMEVVNARAVADDKAVRPPSLQFRDLLALHSQPDRDTPACMVVAAGKPREA